VKKASEEAVKAAQEEVHTSKEEAVRSEQKALRKIDTLKEELRKTRKDTESGGSERNEMMAKTVQDSTVQTREESTRTKKTIDITSPYPETIQSGTEDVDKSSSEHEEIDTRYITTMLDKMRAPLSSISGFARVMLEEDFPDNMTRQELLPNIVKQSDTLNILLDDLSGKLTAKSHRYGIIRKLVSPNKLINDVIQSMRSVALEKNILIGSAVPDTLPAVEADESSIKQVLNNLIDNALKYNEGDSTVIIKAQVLENELLILIEDHGIGIPDGELEVILEEFHRASNHGNREGKGLGLSICKQIVESHGGKIRVQSVEGEGSLFGFTLPLTNS
jgi:two-component system sensor histidine kinase VicK